MTNRRGAWYYGWAAGRPDRPGAGVGAGPEGTCVCPACGNEKEHDPGTPCTEIKCPKCGTPMVRKGVPWADSQKGGPGSGNWGHAGRRGQRGGSLPRATAMSRITGKDWERRQALAAGREPPKKEEEVPKGVEVPQFETWQEAQQWAEEQNLADNVSYKGYDPEICNAINQVLAESIQRMPQLRGRMQFLGSGQARNRYAKQIHEQEVDDRLAKLAITPEHSWYRRLRRQALNAYGHKISGNTWASAYGGASPNKPAPKSVFGIGFNDKWCKGSGGATRLRASNERCDTQPGNWHPVGTSAIRSIVDHEVGHHIGAMLGALERGSAMRTWYNGLSYKAIVNGLSEYGASKLTEFVAEGWAEFINSPNPRPIAQRIGTMLMGSYQQLYGGR